MNACFDITLPTGNTYAITAKTPGAAARIAFRNAIRAGIIKHAPLSDPNTGGWEGVSIVARGEHIGRLGWWKVAA